MNKVTKKQGDRLVPPFGFWSGFSAGASALMMLGAYQFTPPRYQSDGIRGDWERVGSAMRQAMREFNERNNNG